MLDPATETRPWAEQLAVDDASYREQLAYLYERSPFYRAKLAQAGFASAGAAGGLAEIAQLPLTEKAEIKASAAPGNPLGAHLCAEPAEIVRIYSTSGTTGSPSYIPLTADDLENWITGSARSYAASGVSAGERIVSTYNAGPFVAGAALAAFDRIGLCHIPVGTGNSERLMLAIDAAAARGRRAHALLRRLPRRMGRRAELRPARVERASGSSWRASRAAASPLSARSSRRAGARASRRRWASATSAPRCGASASSRTGCISAHADSCTPS